MSTVDKLNKVLETKEAIKQAIIDKGGTVGDVFADYPAAIQNIQGGGGSGTVVVPGGMRFAYSKTLEKFPENWDWSEFEKETDLESAFAYMGKLIEVPKISPTPSITDDCFSYCSKLKNIDLSGWDTKGTTSMEGMFNYCSSLENIDYGSFDTSKNKTFKTMFARCSYLMHIPKLDATSNTSTYSSSYSPIYECFRLRNFGGLNGINKTWYADKAYSLSYESLLNIIDGLADGVSGQTLYLTQDCVNMLSDDEIAVATNKGWTISPAKTITEKVIVTDLSQIPSSVYNVSYKTYDFSQYTGSWNSNSTSSALKCNPYAFEADLSSTTDASYMFYSKSNISYIDLKNTQNVKNLSYMCYNLNWTEIPFQMDTQSVTHMDGMFKWCRRVTSIPMMNTTNVTSMFEMFSVCSDLVNVPPLDTQNVTNMGNMFRECASLVSVPQLNTQNVTNMEYMFYGCNSLISIPKLDTQNVTSMKRMFYGCSSLISVHLTTQNVTDMEGVFRDCYSLQSVTMVGGVPEGVNAYKSFENITTNGTFYYDSKYDYSKIIAALPATWTAVPLTE